MMKDNFLPGQITEAFEALATTANAFIWSKISTFNGTIANTSRPFSSTSNAGTTIAELIRQFGENRVPLNNRRVIMDPTTEGDAVALDWFRAADQAGTDAAIRDAVIGHRFGMDWAMDQQVGQAFTNVAGTGFDLDSNEVVGATSFDVAGGTGALTAGMSIQFANHGATYNVVTAPASGTSGTMAIGGRGLRDAGTAAEEITLIDTGTDAVTQIAAFHRDAIAFVNRPIEIDSELQSATSNIIRTIQDPVSGLVVRLEISRQYKQWVWELDMLYGAAVITPEYGVKISYT
jgi:hypothetical protein